MEPGTILSGLALAGILWVGRTLVQMSATLGRMDERLLGHGRRLDRIERRIGLNGSPEVEHGE